MEGAAEAAGLAATGALAAHTLDRPGAPAAAADHHAHCLNCGTALSDHFCAHCGQKAHLHRSIGHIFEELIHGVLHWDSKGWRTLPLLVANPGRLTREYVEGKRARYIAPLSLFLALFLITFIVLGSFGPSLGTAVASGPADRQQALADAGDPGAASEPVLYKIMRGLSKDPELVIVGGANSELTRKAREALSQPELTLYKIKQKAYKLSFLLIPMSVPFVWALFAGRRSVHLYDHTVFVLYSLSFMSMLVLAAVVLSSIGGERVAGLIGPMLTIVPMAHIFAQLRGAYGLTIGGAAWRTMLLSLAALCVAAAYVLLMLLLGLLD
jgi:hypothetical protein